MWGVIASGPAAVQAFATLLLCGAAFVPAASRAADDTALQRHIEEWRALEAGSGPRADITARVTGVGAPTGQLILALHDAVTPFPSGGKPLASAVVAVTGARTIHTFKEVPLGEYAIAVVCDENGNGRLDMHFGVVPAEPIAFSNDATGSFGPPTYAAAKFTLPPEGVTLDMACRRVVN